MTLLSADELIKQSTTRTWYQLGTGGERYFYGQPGYHFISGATMQVRGGIDPIFVPDPSRPGRYRLVSRTTAAPDLDEFSVDFHEAYAGVPRHLLKNTCEWTFYELHSRCGDPSDFHRGWTGSYIMIYAGGLFEGGIDLGTRTARDSDDPLTGSATFKARAIYPVGTLSFGEEAANDVVAEVVDVVYGTLVSCGGCGATSDGSDHIYALTRANIASPSAPGQLVYSLDGGDTWTTNTITGLSSAVEPLYLDIAGSVLIVGGNSAALFFSSLTETGAPGAWSTLTLPAQMNDLYVESASSIWFAGQTGQVYRSANISSGVFIVASSPSGAALQRIHGHSNVVVACGNNGRVVVSTNSGQTWTASTVGSATHQAIALTGPRTWWLGDSSGVLRRTTDGGVSYETITLPGNAPSTINDIVWATPEVGWISAVVSNVARLYATYDGGQSWARDDSTARITNWPTIQRARRLATPTSTPAIAANYLTVGGLNTAGTDGVLIVSAPALV